MRNVVAHRTGACTDALHRRFAPSADRLEAAGPRPHVQGQQSEKMMSQQDDRVDAALVRAVQQLESAMSEDARAADRIRGMAERLEQTGINDRQRVLVRAIVAATAFQEVTGQRIKKVQRLINYLRGQHDAHGLPKPANRNGVSDGLTPEEVARLLAGK